MATKPEALKPALKLTNQFFSSKFLLAQSNTFHPHCVALIHGHLRKSQNSVSQCLMVTRPTCQAGTPFLNYLRTLAVQHCQNRDSCRQIGLQLARNSQSKNRLVLQGNKERVSMFEKRRH